VKFSTGFCNIEVIIGDVKLLKVSVFLLFCERIFLIFRWQISPNGRLRTLNGTKILLKNLTSYGILYAGGEVMLYKIAICDDEKKEIENIAAYLQQFSKNTNINFKISGFSCGENLIEHYTDEQSPFDIIFLDIEMKDLTGIQTAEKIRAIPDRNVLIVFITSYPEYMQDSFDVQASQYLSKPLSYKLFEEKLKKVIGYLDDLTTNITVVSLKDGNIVLYLDNIVCIETDKSQTLKSNLLITTTNETIPIKGKIADLEKELQGRYFISLHRSVLANMRYIKRFNTDTVEFINGKKVELSRRKATEVKDAFSTYTIMRYKK